MMPASQRTEQAYHEEDEQLQVYPGGCAQPR